MWKIVIDRLCESQNVSEWILRVPRIPPEMSSMLKEYFFSLADPIESIKGLCSLNLPVEDLISNFEWPEISLILSDSKTLNMVIIEF